MSDLRKPGSQPGVSKGKSESQKNAAPLTGGNAEGGSTPGNVAKPVTPGRTTANRNKVK